MSICFFCHRCYKTTVAFTWVQNNLSRVDESN